MGRLEGTRQFSKARKIMPISITDRDINPDLLGIIAQQKVTLKEVAEPLAVHASTLGDYLRNRKLSPAQRSQIIDAIEETVHKFNGYIYKVPEWVRTSPSASSGEALQVHYATQSELDLESRLRRAERALADTTVTVASMLDIILEAVGEISIALLEAREKMKEAKDIADTDR